MKHSDDVQGFVLKKANMKVSAAMANSTASNLLLSRGLYSVYRITKQQGIDGWRLRGKRKAEKCNCVLANKSHRFCAAEKQVQSIKYLMCI